MSEIKGPKGVGPAKGIGTTSGARRAERAQSTQASATVDPMVALFDTVADQLASGAISDRAGGMRAAVDAVLGERFGNLPQTVRDAVAADVCQALDQRPDLSARMDRLLRQPG